MSNLYIDVTNTSNIISARYSNAHNDASAMVMVKAESTSLTLGDTLTLDIGYNTDHNQIFTGYVKDITHSTSPTVYDITAYDSMIRANDYFIASDNPDNPFTRNSITAEALVGDLMELAGLTNYGYDATSFTFGTQYPVEVNLTSVYDFCKMIADTLAWHLYADENGKVWFVERWPKLMDSDSPSGTIDDDVLGVSYSTNERDLRNRVVVYGRGSVSAEAQESSPHLPAGFYKTVVASADWIDSQSMAQQAANKNLDLLNDLSEEVNLSIVGNSNYMTRDVKSFSYSDVGISGNWYIHTVDHSFDKSGFKTNLFLRR